MTDKTNKTNDGRLRYRRPEIKEIPLTVHASLCQASDWATYSDPEEDQLP